MLSQEVDSFVDISRSSPRLTTLNSSMIEINCKAVLKANLFPNNPEFKLNPLHNH